MLIRKLIKMILDYLLGIPDIRGLLHGLKLKEQALLKIPRAHASRLEILDYFEQLQDFIMVGFYIFLESQVVHDAVDVSP